MRRKSERTVKSSPIKKSEPTSRRSTRRGRKTPEKSVNEEESEHSSDQASSSENEPEEIIPPKRTRRTSRTIEKSSSAEEVKATTTRPRRARGTTKKDADIPEENAVDDEPNENTDEPTLIEIVEETNNEKVETINSSSVDSSTEPAEVNQIPIEDSNNCAPDENEQEVTPSNEIENNQEPEESVENEITMEMKPDIIEPVESTKTRRRTLKRLEREISNADTPQKVEEERADEQNEVDSHEKSPKKLSYDEVKSSDESKLADQSEIELQNGNAVNSDVADTTAKDTTASETESKTKLNKKKPIVRKRKWLTNKTAAPKVQEIAISTDSLKGLISDVKPVPLSDVKLDSSPEADRESDVIVSSTSIDYNRRSEEHLVESTDDANAVNITTSRKISIVNESEGEPLSPAKHSPCNILYITNLVRPFTVLQLKSLLQRTGKIAEDGFWIDKIKSKCFVKYETEDEAIETRHALHGIRWPTSNPKNLNVDFGTESLMEKAIASTTDEVKPNILSRDDRIASTVDLHESTHDKVAVAERPVREWDLGKKDSHRPREVERIEREKEREQKQMRETGRDNERERERDRERERERDHRGDRDRGERRRRSASISPSRRYTKKDNEPPLRLLDDLFRKTKTTPCIYWLPLTPEQIAVRIEERKKAFERREALRKEREREDAEDRERRREKRREESREKRRAESRDRDKRREGSHEKRQEGSRDREKRRDSRDREKRRDDSRERRDRIGNRDDRNKRRRY